MSIYKRKVNIRHLGISSDGVPRKGFLVGADSSFLPYHIMPDGKKAISWATFNHYRKWLENFIVESEIYNIKKRTFGTKDTYFFADSRKCEEDYLNADVFSEQWEVLKKWVTAAEVRKGDKFLVFSNRFEARTKTGENECRRGIKIFVHPDADTFFEMFGNTENAARLLTMSDVGTVPATLDIPVYISESIRDLGIYDVYNTDMNGESIDAAYTALKGRSVNGEGDVYVESQLKTLLRTKKTYTEEGEECPFFENENGENEMQYLVNAPSDITYADGVFSYNIIDSIKIYGTADSVSPVATFTSGAPKYTSSLPSSGVAEFNYRVGVAAEGGNDGIEYRDRYFYTVETGDNGKQYIAIDYLSIDKPDDYEEDKRYAKISLPITAYDKGIKEGYMIKNDAFINMQDIKVDYDDVYVERGTSAAYEAFNVLGETNTIEDIENYRDDWFRIKGKND